MRAKTRLFRAVRLSCFYSSTCLGLLLFIIGAMQLFRMSPSWIFAGSIGFGRGVGVKLENGWLLVDVDKLLRPEVRGSQDIRIDRRMEWPGVRIVFHSGVSPSDHSILLSTSTSCRIGPWVPLMISAPFLAPIALRARRHTLRAWRVKRGQCVRCGYYLRASRLACPECGLQTRSRAEGPRNRMGRGS